MPKAEKGSIKYLANKMKAKGLQKLRWYCQMCQKQCRDENGFKCHTTSESHQRQLLLFAENPHRYLDEFSKEFADGYIELLRRRFGTKRVSANQIYQEYISDKNHLHMNATKWLSLTGFVKWLGREGHCTVDETEKGWFVTWIDKDPETLLRQQVLAKKSKMNKDHEERLSQFVEKQVESSSTSEKTNEKEEESKFTELKRDKEEEKIVVNLELKDKKEKLATPSSSTDVFKNLMKQEKDKWETSSFKSFKSTSTSSSRGKKTALEEIREEEERRKMKKFNKDYWLHEGIVVKIMTKRLGDKFYKEKGEIIQVIDKYVAVVKMLSNGTKVKVDQEHLETVIPSIGGEVLIVNGEYCSKKGVLKEIHIDKFCASISLLSNDSTFGRTVELPYEFFSKVPQD